MKFKQGDTFDYSGPVQVLDPTGTAVDMTNWTVASQVRFPDARKTVNLVAAWLDGGFTSVRLQSTDTQSWETGVAEIDVQFTSPGGAVVSTETVRFHVVKDVTRA